MLLAIGVVLLFLVFLYRIYQILPSNKLSKSIRDPHILVLLGSGGHTSEMFSLLEELPLDIFIERTWMYTEGDTRSLNRAKQWEADRKGTNVRHFHYLSALSICILSDLV